MGKTKTGPLLEFAGKEIGTRECVDCGRTARVKVSSAGYPNYNCAVSVGCGSQHWTRTGEGARHFIENKTVRLDRRHARRILEAVRETAKPAPTIPDTSPPVLVAVDEENIEETSTIVEEAPAPEPEKPAVSEKPKASKKRRPFIEFV